MNKKSLKITFILLINMQLVFGQISFTGYHLNSVPPSPNAASLGVYGEISADLYTGTPVIDLPIYRFENNDIDLKLSLSYNIHENKVEQESSWIGLGWSLNAGGVVTRSRIGLCDLTINGGVVNSTDPICAFNQPDNFYFNFDKYQGQFIITSSKQVVLLKQSDLKIELVNNSDEGFRILTPDGIKYEFLQKEFTYTSELTMTKDSTCYLYPSSWYLTKITMPSGREIVFTYSTSSYPNLNLHLIESHNERIDGAISYIMPDEYALIRSKHSNIYLTAIDFGIGRIEFISQNREDLRIINPSYIPQKLSEILVKRNSDNEIIKRFFLNTSYFNSGTSFPDYQTKRLRLDNIDEYGNGSEALRLYSFDYNTTVNLPEKYSPNADLWGFYNGPVNSYDSSLNHKNFNSDGYYSKANLLSKITYSTGGYSTFEYEENCFSNRSEYTHGAGNRIQKIKKYEGSRLLSEKIYEYTNQDSSTSGKLILPLLNKNIFIAMELIPIPSYPYFMLIGGQFESTNKSNCLNLGTGAGGHFVGYSRVLEYSDENHEFGKTEYMFENIDVPAPTDIKLLLTPMQIPIINGTPKSISFYERRSGQDYRIKEINYLFNVSNPLNVPVSTPNTFYILPLETCESRQNNQIQSFILSSWIHKDVERIKEFDRYNSSIYNETVKTFYYESNTHKLVTREELIDSRNQNVTTKYIYPQDINGGNCYEHMNEIDQAFQQEVTYLHSTYSDPQVILDNLIDWWHGYPEACYDESGNFQYGECLTQCLSQPQDQETSAINSMLSKNMIFPIQSIKSINNNVVEANYEKYIMDRNKPLHKSHYSIEMNSPIIEPEPPYITMEQNYIKSNSFNSSNEQFFFDEYDETGNILQVHNKNNIYICYLWGYNKSYPVAVIENASLQEVATVFGGSIPDLGSQGLSQNQQIMIRSGLPDALITTYSYIPLIGLKSKADSNGVTTYFEYDPFGRLKFIKNDDGQILKQYDYHYYNQ